MEKAVVSTLQFVVEDVTVDGPITNEWSVLLGICCDFCVVADGADVYRVEWFTPLEFALAAARWGLMEPTESFTFASLEASNDLVCFEPIDQNLWRVTLTRPEESTPDAVLVVPHTILRSAVAEFISGVPASITSVRREVLASVRTPLLRAVLEEEVDLGAPRSRRTARRSLAAAAVHVAGLSAAVYAVVHVQDWPTYWIITAILGAFAALPVTLTSRLMGSRPARVTFHLASWAAVVAAAMFFAFHIHVDVANVSPTRIQDVAVFALDEHVKPVQTWTLGTLEPGEAATIRFMHERTVFLWVRWRLGADREEFIGFADDFLGTRITVDLRGDDAVVAGVDE